MTTVAPRRRQWSDDAIAALEDSASCPRCGTTLDGRRCRHCGADYSGAIGGELWDASLRAVAALRTRQAVLDRVPVHPVEEASTEAAKRASRPVADVVPVPLAPPRSSATVQSVLAVAGAGLVAVAAVVFTFLNPDLTDDVARAAVIAAVTVVFLVGAAMLVRRRLGFSAEAVGGLGVVFLALDVRSVAVADGGWAGASVATLVAGAMLLALALALRLRTWMLASLAALALVPALAGAALAVPVIGWLGSAAAAFALIGVAHRCAPRFGSALRTDGAALTVVQIVALGAALVHPLVLGSSGPGAFAVDVCGVLAAGALLALVSTRNPAPRMWSFIGGASGTAAVTLLPLAVGEPFGVWLLALIPAAAALGAITVVAVAPMPRRVDRGYLAGGAVAAAAVAAVPTTLSAVGLGGSTVLRADYSSFDAALALATTCGLAALAVGAVGVAVLRERLHPVAVTPVPALGTRWVGYLGVWYAGVALLCLLTIPSIAAWGRVLLGLGLAVVLSLAVAGWSTLRRPALRAPLVASAHVLVLFAVVLAWRDTTLAVWTGAAFVAAVVALSFSVPRGARFAHVGVGYAYALVVFASALGLAGVGSIALVCLTTSAGAVVAVGATFTGGVRVRAWYAVLAVTTVPFLLGVAQVVFERSGWTALSTGLIFALALALVTTRRTGLVPALRVAAAVVLVPSLAVVVVCLGAQLLPGSGSPIVLPIIAAFAAVVLGGGASIGAVLVPRIGPRGAGATLVAIEASTLLTAAIAVGLALVREAAGLGTSLVVLAILGAGGLAAAFWSGRRYGWWLAGAGFTGALWCAWGLTGVVLVEAYLLPPTLAAAVVAVMLTLRGIPSRALYGAALAAAIAPVLVIGALTGPPARLLALLGAAGALAVLGVRFRGRLSALRGITLAAAIVAGAAGAVQAVRFGLGLDPLGAVAPIAVCLALSVAGAVPAVLAARGLRTLGARFAGSRWLLAPALVMVPAGAWSAIERDWPTIWTMWGLLLGLLAVLVATAWRDARGGTTLPPVWFVLALAFVTAVVAWSPRDLRVEWFSLPLGAALLLAGAIALREQGRSDAAASGIRSLSSWPTGWSGSWTLLAPGIVVSMSASIAATFTDPLTWRAILVIVLALLAILVGAARRLAAPFLIGVVVLPVENALAFLVQIGRGIEAMPWWITLAVVGAVLLIIAVTYERRADAGIAARLRDLA